MYLNIMTHYVLEYELL